MPAAKRFSVCHRSGEPAAPVIAAALNASAAFAADGGLGPAAAAKLAVIVDELVGNLLRHGEAECEIRIDLTLRREADEVAVVLEDNCRPFDPRATEFAGPDAESGGGVGLALVRGLATIDDYERDRDVNRLSLRLRA
jgi:serine/threonine-protein kinase RsbW